MGLGFMRLFKHRGFVILTLGLSLLLLHSAVTVGYAQTDWPEEVFIPPSTQKKSTVNPIRPKVSSHKKKSFWRFLFGGKKQPSYDASVSPLEKYGKPRETEPSPYPLIRLPYAIQTVKGKVFSGMYLLKPYPSSTLEQPVKKEAYQSESKVMQLAQRDNTVLVLTMHAVKGSEESLPSPLEKIDPDRADRPTAQVKRSLNEKMAVFYLDMGSAQYESDPFPILYQPQQETVR